MGETGASGRGASARTGRTRDESQTQHRPGRTAKITLAALSVVVLLITGYGWRSLDTLKSHLTTVSGLGLGGKDDGATDILMVGVDSRTDAQGNPLPQSELDMLRAGDATSTNTDTIVLIRVPNDGSSATAISIPRDSWVKVPGIGMSKINAAFGATKEATRQKLVEQGDKSPADIETKSTQAGREALIQSVSGLTGITVDHYAEVSLLGFVLLTDAVGGVDVCLKNAVDEPMSGAHFPAGEQTLSGPNALSFVRQRHQLPRGDLDRIVRQQAYMASLAHKVLSAGTLSNPGKVDQLSKAVQRSIVLDSNWDVIKFAQQLQNLAGGHVRFMTIPVVNPDATSPDGESIVKVDPEQVHSFVDALVGRTGAARAGEPSTAGPAPKVDPSTVTVQVSNDSTVSGLASDVSTALTAMGYREGTVGNFAGTSVDSSQVRAHDTGDHGAAAVAAALGGLTVHADPTLPTGTVQVVLADDYSGPGSTGATDTGASSGQQDPTGTGSATPTPDRAITAGGSGPACVN